MRITISEDFALELVGALNRAIGLSSVHALELRDGFLDTANKLDDVINESVKFRDPGDDGYDRVPSLDLD